MEKLNGGIVLLLPPPNPPKLKPVDDEAGAEPNENVDGVDAVVVEAETEPNENVEDEVGAVVVATLSDGFDEPKLGN